MYVTSSVRRSHLKADCLRHSRSAPALELSLSTSCNTSASAAMAYGLAGSSAFGSVLPLQVPLLPTPLAMQESPDFYPQSPLYFPDSPVSPPLLDDNDLPRPLSVTQRPVASVPGTPRSPQREQRIRRSEWTGMQAEIEQITRPEEEFIGDDDWERSDPEDDVFGGGGDGDRDGDGEEDRDGDRDGDREEDADRARDGDIIEDVPAASSVSTTGSCNRQPVSPDIPQHKWDENNPDPFHEALVDAESLPPRSSVHTDDGVYMLYVLVTWLHSQFHLPFRACNTILMVFALILHTFGVVVSGPILTTLPSVMSKLKVEPTFRVLPVCPRCLEVCPDKPKTHKNCTACGTNLYKTGRTQSGKSYSDREPVPELRFPYKSLASQLAKIISLPGMEEELEQWRQKDRNYP